MFTSLTAKTRVQRNKELFSKKIKGKWYILEKNKKFVRELNETAGYIWSLLRNPTSIQSITDKLNKKYEVGKPQALKDIKSFIKDYLKKGLIEKI